MTGETGEVEGVGRRDRNGLESKSAFGEKSVSYFQTPHLL